MCLSRLGPYNSLNSTYRGVFENVNISDTTLDGLANFKSFLIPLNFKLNIIIRFLVKTIISLVLHD